MSAFPRKSYTLRLKSGEWKIGERSLIMGILNVTPDSFTDGGKFLDPHSAFEQAQKMIDAGADIVDIGGESTRPFSDPVPLEIELERVVPLIREIRKTSSVLISVDTTKAEVARQAISAGADIINDVSSLQFDEEMVQVAASSGAPLILMHMQGTPKTMQQSPSYASLFSEIIAFLEERIQFAVKSGVDRQQIIVDPGIGFGKAIHHNLLLIRDLEVLHCLDRPILLGTSRKRFIGTILDKPVEEREVGTAVVHSFAVASGVHILRVHDVPFHKQVATMADALREGSYPTP